MIEAAVRLSPRRRDGASDSVKKQGQLIIADTCTCLVLRSLGWNPARQR